MRPAPWHRVAVLAALMLAAFTFNTAENLPIGLLELIADSLRVSVSSVGLLVTGYGVTVAVASLPLAHVMRAVPRRHVLTGLLAALVVSSVVAALATSYWVLLGARLLTALAQALFWAVMGPVAVGLFAPGIRGRVVGALSVAGSLALVLGVPAGSWLGRQSGWPVPVAVPAALGAVCLVTIAVLLPTSRPEEEPAAYGTCPDARRFGVVLAAGALSATGAFTGYTYIVKFLGDVSGLSPSTVSALLVAFGAACLAGVMMVGGALGPVFMTTQNEMLRCAPGRTDLALAANSGAYNAGIAAGAALGGLVLPLADVRGTFLAGGLLAVGACAVLLGGRLLRPAPGSAE
jgi:predicted MFS family arabinose efflux permease